MRAEPLNPHFGIIRRCKSTKKNPHTITFFSFFRLIFFNNQICCCFIDCYSGIFFILLIIFFFLLWLVTLQKYLIESPISPFFDYFALQILGEF